MELVKKRVQDPLILNLIQTGLKANIFQESTPEIGTRPLLSNIYLHELDLYMEQLSKKYQRNKAHSTDSSSIILSNRIHNEEGNRNCKYIRYADDFLVGVLGPRSLAETIKKEIHQFLKEKLKIEMNLEKTKITHISKSINFLGFTFGRRTTITRRKKTIPTLDVNMKKVIARLAEANFCDKGGEPTPAFSLLRLPQSETNYKANQILRGLAE
jgi:hypothetical protein